MARVTKRAAVRRCSDKLEDRSAGFSPAVGMAEQQIAALNSLGVADLRKAWTDRFPRPAPPIQSADVLLRLYAWRLQAEAFGALDAETSAKLARLKRALVRGKPTTPPPTLELKPGSTLSREWRGQVHQVLVLDQGFEHQGKPYRNLSEVARAITGTRWSGPRFFGLEADQAKPARSAEAGSS